MNNDLLMLRIMAVFAFLFAAMYDRERLQRRVLWTSVEGQVGFVSESTEPRTVSRRGRTVVENVRVCSTQISYVTRPPNAVPYTITVNDCLASRGPITVFYDPAAPGGGVPSTRVGLSTPGVVAVIVGILLLLGRPMKR